MSLTGLCWSFDWYKRGMGKILGAPLLQRSRSKIPPSSFSIGNTISLSLVLQAGNKVFPQRGTVKVNIPEEANGVFLFTKNNEEMLNVAASDRAYIDRYLGNVVLVEKFSKKSFGEKIAASIKPLHTGEIFGLFSKIVYFVACLIATSLPVTGTIIWWNQRKKEGWKKRS